MPAGVRGKVDKPVVRGTGLLLRLGPDRASSVKCVRVTPRIGRPSQDHHFLVRADRAVVQPQGLQRGAHFYRLALRSLATFVDGVVGPGLDHPRTAGAGLPRARLARAGRTNRRTPPGEPSAATQAAHRPQDRETSHLEIPGPRNQTPRTNPSSPPDHTNHQPQSSVDNRTCSLTSRH